MASDHQFILRGKTTLMRFRAEELVSVERVSGEGYLFIDRNGQKYTGDDLLVLWPTLHDIEEVAYQDIEDLNSLL